VTESETVGGIPSHDGNVKDGPEQAAGLAQTTLGGRGPVLAMGVPGPGGKLARDIELRPWKGRQMRELGRLREENENANMSEHIGLVLSSMCSRLGGQDFSKLQAKERKLFVSRMYMGDVFHAYCYARLKSLGPDLHVNLTCPACRLEFPWTGDLETLTVATAERVEDAMWEYELLSPVELRGQAVERLSMGPPYWHHVERAQVEGSLDLEGGKLALVAGAVYGIVGRDAQTPLTDAEIDELEGRDIEGIIARLDDHHVGPDMRIETRCERKGCRSRILRPIDWSYQSFFGSSSRSPTPRSSSTGCSRSPFTLRARSAGATP